jgi:hypothetical protein
VELVFRQMEAGGAAARLQEQMEEDDVLEVE